MATVREDPEDGGATDVADADGSDATAIVTDRTMTMDGPPEPPVEVVPAEIAQRYRILGELGRGGMGTVYRALDTRLGRMVALKLVTSSHLRRQRLLREAQALAQLAHPNVVPVYDVGTVDDAVYMAMELVDGVDVRRWLGDAVRSPTEIVAVFAAAGDGLAAAHAAGLVHRDVKPANVIIGADGRVRVVDFGLVRAVRAPDVDVSVTDPGSRESSGSIPAMVEMPDVTSGDGPSARSVLHESVTRHGRIVGTPRYMSPEQRMGRPADARTDQFSFCVALYEALYAERPFPNRTARRAFDHDGTGPVTPPAQAGIPTHVRRALRRGLSWDPAARYPTMAALVAELRRDLRAVRVRTALAAGGIAAVAVAVSTAALVGRGDEPCGGAAERAAAVWPTTLRAAVDKALLGTGSPHAPWVAARLGAQVDGYLVRWRDVRTQACRATRVHGEQSEATMERRMSCLDDSLDQVAAFLRALTAAGSESAMNSASAGLDRVSALALCSDVDALARRQQEPVRPEEAATVQALREATRELNALNAVSDSAGAEPVARRVLELARRVTHGETRAQALFAGAEAARLRSAFADNARLLDEALALAAGAGNATLLADAWSSLLWQTAVVERRPLATEELLRATKVALALARHEPERDRLEVEIGHVIASVAMHGGHLEEAEQRFRALLVRPQHDSRLSATANNLALVLIYRDHLDEARTFLEKSRQLDEAVLGKDQPYAADHALNVGLSYHWGGDLVSGERWYRAAIDESRRRDGAAAIGTLYQLYLGHVLLDRGAWAEARPLLDTAVDGFASSIGPDDELTRHARVLRARLRLGRGDVAGARADIAAVMDAIARTGSVDHLSPGYTDPLVVDARVAIAEGNLAGADAALRRAAGRYQALYGASGLLVSEVHLASAELASAQRRYGEVIDTATRTLELLARGGSHAQDPRRAEALWLRARARRTRGSVDDAAADARAALAIWQAVAPALPRVADVQAFLRRD